MPSSGVGFTQTSLVSEPGHTAWPTGWLQLNVFHSQALGPVGARWHHAPREEAVIRRRRGGEGGAA